MNAEEYQQQQESISTAFIAVILKILESFAAPKLSEKEWMGALWAMYGPTNQYRNRAAELGRNFYDSQRAQHVGGFHKTYLANYKFDWFAEAMQPIKADLMKPGADESVLSRVAMRAVKEVENGGRKTILRGVKTDSQVKGWARIASGRETCAFCLMLVSRGATKALYFSAADAGLNTDDTTAMQLVGAGDEKALDKLMVKWHPGCDCRVVPIFNRKSWPGRAAAQRAYKLWNDQTDGYSGKDALNAFRRAVERGDIDEKTLTPAA